uniref:NADH-ubiquinone oxidoreductase chain 6 n=1 Tax=Chaoborus sp. ZK-2019 TaxID=2527953 RepID=A0A411NHH8_9DIPT|nr:NADH dehydrogenase subunit 6 [Chaoborus sp. ZK-2019]
MYLFMLLFLSIMTTAIFLKTKHPLTMGMTLLIQTLMICLMTGIMSKTFWFSYILFLIFLGGMLILFIYMTAIASNEMFAISFKSMTLPMMMIFLMMMMLMFNDSLLININKSMDMMNSMIMSSLINENCLHLNKIYNFPSNFISIILMNYLLLTLVVIVKITNIFYGPLRSMK